EVLDDVDADPAKVTKVMLCSGKIYFELDDRRRKENHEEVAIIRLEQIYPLPQKQLDELYKKYTKAIWYWVQEEPLNMGAAAFLRMNLTGINFHIVSRLPRASIASGYAKIHTQEQNAVIDRAFTI